LIAQAGVGAVIHRQRGNGAAVPVPDRELAPGGDGRPLPKPFVAALRAGGRYALHAPVVRRLPLRAALFLDPATAPWGLLPLIAAWLIGRPRSSSGA
jgi:hypothetical protein